MSIGKAVLCRNGSKKHLLKLRHIWYTRHRKVVAELAFWYQWLSWHGQTCAQISSQGGVHEENEVPKTRTRNVERVE